MANGLGFVYILITQVIFFILTIVLILWFVKTSRNTDVFNPKEILDRRLASGEISAKEYDSLVHRLAVLNKY